MSLRARLVLAFAGVAIGTALVIAAAIPIVVGSGVQQLQNQYMHWSEGDWTDAGEGHMEGWNWVAATPAPQTSTTGSGQVVTALSADLGRDTTLRLVLIALGAGIVASAIGFLAADRLLRPLRRLRVAARDVAGGDLTRRSGLTDRADEIGELGRSFDEMAGSLQAADASRRRFLQDAVHELRTPLAVIDATASAIIDDVYRPEPRHLETIRDQSRLLARIVDDLRTIALAEAGSLKLRQEPLDAADLVTAAAEAFQAKAEAAGQRLHGDAETDLAINGDPERLQQVIGALVDNAVRHTPAGGAITIAGHAEDGHVRIKVDDTGPGIDPVDLPHLFERFYQADLSRDRARGSSGLGLAIVKAIAEAHGGRVGATNRASGGAEFWVELPRRLAGPSLAADRMAAGIAAR